MIYFIKSEKTFLSMQETIVVKRNWGVDIIKGVAITLMVLGHGIQYIGNGDFWNNPFFQIIYSFHMPLFMLVSGYLFFLTVSRKSLGKIITTKLKSLILPVVSWRTL